MTFNQTIDKARKDFEEALSRSTTLQAVVGAGDLAVEKLRALQEEFATRLDTFDPKEFRERAGEDVRNTPDRFVEMSAKGQAALADALSNAFGTYGNLATRGREVVERIRTQQATEDLRRQAGSTASQAKATSTTARKAAGSTARSARSSAAKTGSTARSATGSTASTARSSASRTKTSAKATTTSAKRTASTAKKATTAAAGKVGKSSPAKKSSGR